MNEKVLYVGIDIAKAKFDVSFTINGKDCIYYQTIENHKDGFKKLVNEIKKYRGNTKSKKFISVWNQQEFTTASFVNICKNILL